MSDPKYPVYEGELRFDDENIFEVVKSSSGIDVKYNGETIGGDLATADTDLLVLDASVTAALGTKIKKAWFNNDPGAGASSSTPVMVPGENCALLVFNCKLATANVVRVNSSSKADTVVWLAQAPTGTPFSAASGGSFAGYKVNCCFAQPTVAEGETVPDYGLTGATFSYNKTLPDISIMQ